MHALTVRALTAAFRETHEQAPTCLSSWPMRVSDLVPSPEGPLTLVTPYIPWQAIGGYLSNGLLTPKDYASWYKNILHGALAVRKIFRPSAPSCRLCGAPREELSHFHCCPVIRVAWDELDGLVAEIWRHIGIVGGWGMDPGGSPSAPDTLRVCLGIHQGRPPPGGVLALFMILWKMTIIAFTRVELENAKFIPKQVWELTLRRLIVRVNARAFGTRTKALRAEARDAPAPEPPGALNRRLYPLATVSGEGRLTWAPPLERRLIMLKLIKPRATGPDPPTVERVTKLRRPIDFQAAK